MPAERSRRSLLAALGVAGVAGCLGRGDGSVGPPAAIDSDWPAPGYDHRRTYATDEASGPTSRVAELWASSTEAGLSAPVVADGRVLVGGDDGVVRALDAVTGELDWDSSVGGTAGTPRVRDGLVYAPTGEAVVALDAADGSEMWRQPTPDREGLLLGPHGLYTVGPSGETGRVVARTPADGTERWRTELEGDWTSNAFANDDTLFVPVGGRGQPWAIAPETGETHQDRLVAAEDGSEAQLCRDGRVFAAEPFFGSVDAWALTGDPYERAWHQGIDAYTGFALAAGQRNVYVHAKNGDSPGLYALSVSDGTEAWYDESVAPVRGRPTVASDAVVVRTSERLRCFDPSDGTELWRHPGDGVGSAPALVDDMLFTTVGDTVRAFRAT